jgi:hypothetical protein
MHCQTVRAPETRRARFAQQAAGAGRALRGGTPASRWAEQMMARLASTTDTYMASPALLDTGGASLASSSGMPPSGGRRRIVARPLRGATPASSPSSTTSASRATQPPLALLRRRSDRAPGTRGHRALHEPGDALFAEEKGVTRVLTHRTPWQPAAGCGRSPLGRRVRQSLHLPIITRNSGAPRQAAALARHFAVLSHLPSTP